MQNRESGPGTAGVVLARDLSVGELRALRRRGTVVPVRRGAYVPPRAAESPARDARRLTLDRIAAVGTQLTLDAAFSHESAALLWDLPVLAPSGRVHVTQRSRPRAGGDPTLVRHCGALRTEDSTRIRGYRVTTLERTIVDCSAALEPPAALVIADAAARHGIDTDRLAELVVAGKGSRGIANVRRIVALMDGRAESPGETLTRWHLVAGRLPTPEPQIPVRTRRGWFRIDLGWPELRAGIEFDGLLKYAGAGDSARAVIQEKLRQDALDEAGWRLLRLTWSDLAHPATLVARAHRLRALATGPEPRSVVRDRDRRF